MRYRATTEGPGGRPSCGRRAASALLAGTLAWSLALPLTAQERETDRLTRRVVATERVAAEGDAVLSYAGEGALAASRGAYVAELLLRRERNPRRREELTVRRQRLMHQAARRVRTAEVAARGQLGHEQRLNELLYRLRSSARRDLASARPGSSLAPPVRAALLDLTVHLRRVLGPLHTEVPALFADGRCAGDLVRDRLLWRYFEAVTEPRLSEVPLAAAAIQQQLGCLSQRQLGVLESTLVQALPVYERLYGGGRRGASRRSGEVFADALRQAVAPLMFLLRDNAVQTRGRRSAALEWLVAHRESLERAAARPTSLFHDVGAFFYDRASGALGAVTSSCIPVEARARVFGGRSGERFLKFAGGGGEETCNALPALVRSAGLDCSIGSFVPVAEAGDLASGFVCDPGCGERLRARDTALTADGRRLSLMPDRECTSAGGGGSGGEDAVGGGGSLGGILGGQLGCLSENLYGSQGRFNRAQTECVRRAVSGTALPAMGNMPPSGGPECWAADGGTADEELPEGVPEGSTEEVIVLDETSDEWVTVYRGPDGNYYLKPNTGAAYQMTPDEYEAFENGGGFGGVDEGGDPVPAADPDAPAPDDGGTMPAEGGGAPEGPAPDPELAPEPEPEPLDERGFWELFNLSLSEAWSRVVNEEFSEADRDLICGGGGDCDPWNDGGDDGSSHDDQWGGPMQDCGPDQPGCADGCTTQDDTIAELGECMIDALVEAASEDGYPPGSDPRLINLINVREDAGTAGFGLFGRYDGCFDGANPARTAACPESTVTLCPQDQPDCACAPSAPPVRIDTAVCQEIQCAEGMAGVAFGASCGCQGVVAGHSATPVEDAFLATGLQDCPAENPNCGAQYGDW